MKPYFVKGQDITMLSGDVVPGEPRLIGGTQMLDGSVIGNDGNTYKAEELETR